jgi:hypothetical protein
MTSKGRIEELISSLEGTTAVGLSVAEQGIVNFVKLELKKMSLHLTHFNREMTEGRWDNALVAFLTMVQKANLLYSYLMQPSVLSTLVTSRIGETAEETLDTISLTLGEALTRLKGKQKEMGIESISANLNSSPPSFNISIVMKGT